MEIGIGGFLLPGTKVLRKWQIHSKQLLHQLHFCRSVRQVFLPRCGKLQLQVPLKNSKMTKNISASSWLQFIVQIDWPTRRAVEGQLPGGSCWKQLRRLSDGHSAAHQAPVCHTGAASDNRDGQHTRRCAKSEKGEKEERIGFTGGAPWFSAAAPRSTERDL